MICSRWVALLVVASCCLAGGTSAAAEPKPGDRAAAKTRLTEARRLYDRGDYEGSLRELTTAYGLVPSPKILFSFGQAYRGLARHVEALESFEKFLAEAPDADPALRREARQYVDELQRRVATVEITSDTDGAEISIDGRPQGVTPRAGGIRIAPGPHEVVVRKLGATAFSQRVDVAAGKTATVEAKLAPAPAPVLVPASLPPPQTHSLPPLQTAPLPLRASGVPAEEVRPIYARWWFWTAIGAVSAGAVATAVAVNRSDGTPGICDCTFSPGTVAIPTP